MTFLAWLRATHGKADTPTGDLAREFGTLLSDTEDLQRVRTSLAYYVDDDSPLLDVFDAAWSEYARLPTCFAPNCNAKAAGGASSYCPTHGGRRHQAGGAA